MRTDDLNGGSLKALLLMGLIAANIVAALPNDYARARIKARTPSEAPSAARAGHALSENPPR